LRLVTDIFEFCASEVPRWNSISISGYHMREAGCTAVQEIAFTLGNAREYVRGALARGLDLEDFAPRLSFFFAAHNDLLEEVAKFRVARRLWARMMRDEFGASDRSARLRFHTQTGGSTLTAQQPQNNIVRVAVQALAAVLGGTQSLHTNGYDEALSLPTEEAAKLALRTQQVLAEESGVTAVVDPLGGAWFVEALTDELEANARRYLDQMDDLGDIARAIPFMSEEIHQAAYRWQLELESGERKVVGVNCYEEATEPPRLDQPDFVKLGREQAERLARTRSERDDEAVASALRQVQETASGTGNLVPVIVEAVKVRATIGEISGVLRDRWGTFQA
jgi:methylmalonyl-CoA mutase N-terminal domain/subunit